MAKTMNLSKYWEQIAIAFFAVVVFCFWLFLYPFIPVAREMSVLFLWNSDYIAERLMIPGGLAQYLGEGLAQFFLNPVNAALAYAILFVVTQWLASKLLRQFFPTMKDKVRFLFSLIPPVLLWYVAMLPHIPLTPTMAALLVMAAELLDWEPMNGQYGRCTKGMALAYLADSYMWKAYRTGNDSYYADAKKYLKQIIDDGPYVLNRSFSTLFDADEAWGKEAIWQVVLNEGDQWGGWDGGKWSEAHGWVGFYYGAPANGAWGTYAVSYELYDSYEDGDKRRDASLVTACIPESELDRISQLEGRDIKSHWKQTFKPTAWLANADNAKYCGKGTVDRDNYNNNTILYDPDCPIGFNPFAQEFVKYNTFHREPGDIAPTVYSTKHWRNGRGTHWSGDQWLPDHIYMKRLANVYLDYAECCFRTGETAEGWKYVNLIRNRAFGNLEVGHKDELTAKYNNYYKWLGTFYKDNGFGYYTVSDEYPIPFNEAPVTVPDAEQYYTALKAAKGFTSPVWQVAVNEERRKEFNAEWSLKTDIQKSGYLVDHMDHNYPKGYGTETGMTQIYTWRTYRGFDFNEGKMDMPIPQDELIKNPLCDQNDAYKE